MTKTENKNANFSQAVKRLNEANIAYLRHADDDIYQDALIKRFEFTFELGWKSLREFLIAQGYQLEIPSPKGVFALAYREGILRDEALWLDMLESRNLTSHDYGRELSKEIADKINNRFCKALADLNKYIADQLNS